jgi:Predicted membrane protein (DUF2157)
MSDYESLLNRWQSAGVLDAEAANRIRAWESVQASAAAPPPASVPPKETRTEAALTPSPQRQAQVAGVAWQGRVALILGGILLASGIILFVSAHWDQLGPGMRYLLVMAMVTVFHLGGAVTRENFKALSTTLHAVGTISTGAAIALVGQIFNIQEHWPAAVLMWAIAALLGWILLRDDAQQVLTLLLVPSWLICEWSYAADNHIGVEAYVGRFLFVWAILYLTFFIGTERRIVRGILFAVSAIAAVTSTFLLLDGWRSWYGMHLILRSTRASGDGSTLPQSRSSCRFFVCAKVQFRFLPPSASSSRCRGAHDYLLNTMRRALGRVPSQASSRTLSSQLSASSSSGGE